MLPFARVFYAVKANPASPVLVGFGSSFDAASTYEIDACLSAGAGLERISYGNTIKKEADIASAYERGIRQFAFDSGPSSRSSPGPRSVPGCSAGS